MREKSSGGSVYVESLLSVAESMVIHIQKLGGPGFVPPGHFQCFSNIVFFKGVLKCGEINSSGRNRVKTKG